MTTIADKAVLVTGANRGVGRALVEEALSRGAARVYTATRKPFEHPDARVRNLILDVTDPAQIKAAAAEVDELDLLINNAGLSLYDDLTDRGALEQQLAVNLFGLRDVTQTFLPALERSGGSVVNILSTAAWAPVPIIPSYSISKAAAFSFTQSLRAHFAGRVGVHAVILGPTDTEMSRDFDVPKASAESVARNVFDGLANGEDEIFPDPTSATLAESWRGGAVKEMELGLAPIVPASVAAGR